MQNKANGIKYRSFRTGDGDRDRGTLNLMASVGRGVCQWSRTRPVEDSHGPRVSDHVRQISHEWETDPIHDREDRISSRCRTDILRLDSAFCSKRIGKNLPGTRCENFTIVAFIRPVYAHARSPRDITGLRSSKIRVATSTTLGLSQSSSRSSPFFNRDFE